MKKRIIPIIDLVLNSQAVILAGSALLVGFTTGIGVWLFKKLIDLFHLLLFGYVGEFLSQFGGWTILFIPVIGGAIVGLIAMVFIKNEKLHGVAGIMQAVALSGGRMRYKRVPFKALASAMSIGAGASVGPEDPSVQIGASLGSMFGQILHLSDERIRTLVAAGAAAAIAAAFNAPIAGVFFALEIILGQIGGNALGMVLVAAVVSSVFTQAVSGAQPAFAIPVYAFQSIWELPLYLVLGILAGPLSALYVRLIYVMQDMARKIKLSPPFKTMISGLVVGLTGIFLPQIFGVGYETIGEILNKNSFTFWFLLVLLLAKIILTPINMAGGFFGGVFAPSLFLGAALGGAFGSLMTIVFPNLAIHPAAFALVGMAAVLAGAVHAPLTAVILLFEMTNDYRIILPLMFSVAVSLLISQHIQKNSVYAMGLARHGIRLDRGHDVEVLQAITVGEAMHKDPQTISESDVLDNAFEKLNTTRSHGLPVVDSEGLLLGILTIQDIERARESGLTKVRDAFTQVLEVAYSDEPLSNALARMSRRDIGRLPVVTRENPRELIGILRRSDMIHAYDIALTRRTTQRHMEHEIRLDALTPERVDVTDVVVEAGSEAVGKQLMEIPFPQESVIASIRRRGEVFIPHGNTVINAGDILVVVAQGDAREGVLRLCRFHSSEAENKK